MRIVVITNRFGDVGTHPQLTRLALHLKGAGHDVRAISLAPTGTIAEMFAASDIQTGVIDASRRGSFPSVVWRLSGVFRRWRPDAIVVFLYEAIIPTRLAAWIARVPTVISSIRNEYFGPRYREVVLRATERLSTATVVNSQRIADSLVARRISNRGHLVVIHNGIDVTEFASSPRVRETTRASLGLADQEFVWLTIGRLTEQKGLPYLLHALAMVVESLPGSRLLVVGRGRLRNELEGIVGRRGLEGRVSFLGFRNDVSSLLVAADALVMASRYEGMPNAVMEAFASGRPVVGTHVGAVPDLIIDGVTGYVVPPADPHALASAMEKLALASLVDRNEMGERGRARIQELCDLQLVMAAWTNLIEEPSRARRKH